MNHTYKQHQQKAYNPSYTLPPNTANLTRPERDAEDRKRYLRIYRETGDEDMLTAAKRLHPDWTPERDYSYHHKSSSIINRLTSEGWTQKEVSEALGRVGGRSTMSNLATGKIRGISKNRAQNIHYKLKTLDN